MKLGPVTKLEKRKKTTLKKVDDYAMSAHCETIVSFSIYANLEQSINRFPDA